jgi:transposase
MGISRACATKWVRRYREFGDLGLHDRSSSPHGQPTATDANVIIEIERLRRERKWSASRIAFELRGGGVTISRRTVTRHLHHLGLNRRKFVDTSGETNRTPRTITAHRPGHMVHVDVKKVGRIPEGGGWRATAKAAPKPKQSNAPSPRVPAQATSTSTP